jgi:hypothetical protein
MEPLVLCNKLTPENEKCTLPAKHPNACVHDMNEFVERITRERDQESTKQLIDSIQMGTPMLAKDPHCKKCRGRAYNRLPDPVLQESAQLVSYDESIRIGKHDSGFVKRYPEYSLCVECGGYLFSASEPRNHVAEYKPAYVSEAAVEKWRTKPAGNRKDTPDLAAARIADAQRHAKARQAPNPQKRDYMAEAARQAEIDVADISKWNGF